MAKVNCVAGGVRRRCMASALRDTAVHGAPECGIRSAATALSASGQTHRNMISVSIQLIVWLIRAPQCFGL